jgi:hypothetical protein
VFGIVTLTDFLITITVIQTGIFAFLVAINLFKIKKSIQEPATDKIDNELSKKLSSLDTKISLISNEFSQAIKENTENITKLSSTINTTSATTAAALDTANSSLSALTGSSSAFLSPAMTSGFFERNTDSHFLKPEFLVIDEDNPNIENGDVVQNDNFKVDPNVIYNLNVLNQKGINEVATTASITAQNIKSRDFSPSSLNLGSSIRVRTPSGHLGHSGLQDCVPELESHELFNQPVTKETENPPSDPPETTTIEDQKEFFPPSTSIVEEPNTVKDITVNPQPNHKNDKENADLNSSSSDGSQIIENNDRNSNPELDKLDSEIISALKRLGGMDESGCNE